MNPLMNPVGSNAEGKFNCINATVITQNSSEVSMTSELFLFLELEEIYNLWHI